MAEVEGIEQRVRDQFVRLVDNGNGQEAVGTHEGDERMAPRLDALRDVPFRAGSKAS